jgi:hypothetical protein
VRIYAPKEVSSTKLPVGLYYHGGGYVSGNLDLEDPICRIISERTPVSSSVWTIGLRRNSNSQRGLTIDMTLIFGFECYLSASLIRV